jgi:hypothetical protein
MNWNECISARNCWRTEVVISDVWLRDLSYYPQKSRIETLSPYSIHPSLPSMHTWRNKPESRAPLSRHGALHKHLARLAVFNPAPVKPIVYDSEIECISVSRCEFVLWTWWQPSAIIIVNGCSSEGIHQRARRISTPDSSVKRGWNTIISSTTTRPGQAEKT